MPVRDKRGQRRVPLSNESINKTLVLLANVLDAAVEYELLPTNPARGRRRRRKAARPTRRFLEADELGEILAAASELDRAARSDRRIGRRPMIAVMAKSGLRVSEVCQLRWRSVDLHHKRLMVEQSKTDAGVHEVDLSLDLLDDLLAWRAASSPAGVDAFVFPTASAKSIAGPRSGPRCVCGPPGRSDSTSPHQHKSPAKARLLKMGTAGLEPATSRV
jgi:integrase